MQNRSIEQTKQRVRIEDIVRQRGVDLQANTSGNRLEGCCPFHPGDETPSFNIYTDSQHYHCFGCGANGDVIDFVQTFDGCTFQEAFQRLSEYIMTVPPTAYRAYDRVPHLLTPLSLSLTTEAEENCWEGLLTKTHQKYHQTLLNHLVLPEILQRARGITQVGIRTCELGYVDGSWLPELFCIPETQEIAETIGLLSATRQERMVGRLVIPECSDGTCHWMIGRALSRPLRKQRTPKYLGLSLSKPLLGYGLALKRLREGHPIRAILIVEGAIDYVIASQWDLSVVCVALIGTYASRRQLTLLLDLQQRTDQVPLLISLDADTAGRQASHHLLAQLRQRTPRVTELAPIGEAKDIGDLGILPNGVSFLQASIEQALSTDTFQGGSQ
jgi:DNA primase catalytic core